MIFMERFPPNFLCHEREDPDTWAHRDAEVTALLTAGGLGWSRVTVVTVIGWGRGWGGLPEEGLEPSVPPLVKERVVRVLECCETGW